MATSNKIGISAKQAARALLKQGYIFGSNHAGPGIALYNDEDAKYYIIGEEHIFLSQFYGIFKALSKHELAQCSIERGQLVLGPAVSTKIKKDLYV